MTTFEVHAHLWVQDGMWLCGIVDTTADQRTTPDGEFGYSALSSLEPNMLIHCYWIGGLPDDETRDYVRDMIVHQAIAYREQVEQR